MKQLEDSSLRDSLTNLYNRHGFYQIATEIYKKCAAEKLKFMIISVDLDGLKDINASYGNEEGDSAIITVAKALESASTEEDEVIARFEGDAYIVAGICQTRTYADEFIERFKKFIDVYNDKSGKPYTVAASYGMIKSVPEPEKSIDSFMKRADELMLAQKSSRHSHRGQYRSKDRS